MISSRLINLMWTMTQTDKLATEDLTYDSAKQSLDQIQNIYIELYDSEQFFTDMLPLLKLVEELRLLLPAWEFRFMPDNGYLLHFFGPDGLVIKEDVRQVSSHHLHVTTIGRDGHKYTADLPIDCPEVTARNLLCLSDNALDDATAIFISS